MTSPATPATQAPPAAPAPFRNRIVGHGEEEPDQLLANPNNWRIHPKHQQDALEDVLKEVGWVQEVLVNRRSGFVVDGHARVAIAISRGEPTVPVKYVDLTPEEEAKVLATFDPISAMAVMDADQVKALAAGVQTESAAIDALLESLRQEADDLLAQVRPPDLDDLAKTHGDPDPTDLWPVVRLQVPPEVHEQYKSLLGQAPGSEDHEKFAALLRCVDVGALSDPEGYAGELDPEPPADE